MVLCLDIGNTDIDVGVFTDGELTDMFTMEYVKGQQSWSYIEPIRRSFADHGIDIGKVEECVLCSVVHNTTRGFFMALSEILGFTPRLFTNDSIRDMTVKVGNPQEVGVDIRAGCLAVKEKYALPAIVIDMGTATSVTAMDADGAILGVSILTGVITSLKALGDRTGLPVDLSLKVPEKAIGTDTPEALASGAVLGSAYMIDGMIDRFRKEMGTDATVYATGGVAKIIFPLCKNPAVINNHLIFDGLYIYHEKIKALEKE